MNEDINEMCAKFEQLEATSTTKDFDYNQLQDDFYALLENVQRSKGSGFYEEDEGRLEKLEENMVAFKAEQNFYDAEDELNRMFPNRGDDDFDEDSTSYESVFGGD